MFLIFVCFLGVVSAAPSYDERQDGHTNIVTEFQDVVVLVGIPKELNRFVASLLSRKRSGEASIAMDRSDVSDVHVMESFVEPSTPYQVKIVSVTEGPVEAGSDAEVVIAGRRRLEMEPQIQEEKEEVEPDRSAMAKAQEEMKLIGSTEQCGPERERDPVTLTCRPRKVDTSEKIPEVVPVLT